MLRKQNSGHSVPIQYRSRNHTPDFSFRPEGVSFAPKCRIATPRFCSFACELCMIGGISGIFYRDQVLVAGFTSLIVLICGDTSVRTLDALIRIVMVPNGIPPSTSGRSVVGRGQNRGKRARRKGNDADFIRCKARGPRSCGSGKDRSQRCRLEPCRLRVPYHLLTRDSPRARHDRLKHRGWK